MIENLESTKKVILFDGICNLCNTSVMFIIKRDTTKKFVFTAIESKVGQSIITSTGLDTKTTDSIILYNPTDNSYAVRSTAVLEITKEFKGLWKLLQLGWCVPRPIRDFSYDMIAKHRYRWFGKKEQCMLADPTLKKRFLE